MPVSFPAGSLQLTIVIFSAILYIQAYTGQFSDELYKFKNNAMKLSELT